MPKQEAISYKAKFAAEMSEVKEGEEAMEISPAFAYDGSVVYNLPESSSDAVQMFGEGPTIDLIVRSLKIDVQNLSRRYRTQEEAQEAVNGFVPGVSRRASGPSTKQVKELLSKMSKEEIEKLLAGLG